MVEPPWFEAFPCEFNVSPDLMLRKSRERAGKMNRIPYAERHMRVYLRPFLAFITVLLVLPAGAEEKAVNPLSAPETCQAFEAYAASPDAENWKAAFSAFGTSLKNPGMRKASPLSILAANPVLSDFKPKVVDCGFARIWAFPDVKASSSAYIEWMPSPRANAGSVQVLPLPANCKLISGQVIWVSRKAEGSKKVTGSRYLMLAAADRESRKIKLKAFRYESERWSADDSLFADLPPVLTNSFIGSVSFKGSDITLSVDPSSERGDAGTLTYRLVLRLKNGRYALEGQQGNGTPYDAAFRFLEAVNNGQLAVAKTWLADPKLISIPRYLGLGSRPESSAIRLINMASPRSGTFRFRYVSFARNDLILDVAKPKKQDKWVVTAIFIAPSDNLLKQITEALPLGVEGSGVAISSSGDKTQ